MGVSMSCIVKVQKPLASNHPETLWLIYDEADEHVTQVYHKAIPLYLKRAMKADLKGYFHAVWSDVGYWMVGDRVSDQEW